MEVILLERIERLGQMGDVVNVKDGFARNFLLPKNKALRANKVNREYFEKEKINLEAKNLKQKSEAEAVSEKIVKDNYIIIRQASDTGQLYGSVNSGDIKEKLLEEGFSLEKNQIIRLGFSQTFAETFLQLKDKTMEERCIVPEQTYRSSLWATCFYPCS